MLEAYVRVSLFPHSLGRELTDVNVGCSSQSLKKFEMLGGLVSGTEESRGKISLDRPNRQWDYP